MRIRNRRFLKQFVVREPDARAPLARWRKTVKDNDWDNSAQLLATFNNADCVGNNKWIFNIGGNKYRLAAMVWFTAKAVQVLKVMTHAEYDEEIWK